MNAAKAFADEAANILERAISGVLSRNALLYFAYADFEEGRMKYDKVHQMYNKFIGIGDIDPTLVCQTLQQTRKKIFKKNIFYDFIIADLCSVYEIRSSCGGHQIRS